MSAKRTVFVLSNFTRQLLGGHFSRASSRMQMMKNKEWKRFQERQHDEGGSKERNPLMGPLEQVEQLRSSFRKALQDQERYFGENQDRQKQPVRGFHEQYSESYPSLWSERSRKCCCSRKRGVPCQICSRDKCNRSDCVMRGDPWQAAKACRPIDRDATTHDQ
jgi:hypothetical protein